MVNIFHNSILILTPRIDNFDSVQTFTSLCALNEKGRESFY